MRILGIDIGTTSISFAVLERENREVLRTWTIKNDSFIRTVHQWEKLQDPQVIEKKVMDMLTEICSGYKDIASIGLTGQMHGILYVDREGNGISPLYTWQDGRGRQPVPPNGRCLEEEIGEITGECVYTGYGWVSHLYNQRTEQVPEGAVSLCTIPDYIGMRITGRRRPLLHSSMAASLGFFDLEKNRFREEILEELHAGRDMIPEITDRVSVLGRYHGIPVYTAIGDNQASVLGAAGREPGSVLINMGTGGQISVVTDRNIQVPGIETRPYLDGRYLLAGASLCGGRAYAVLERFFRMYACAAGMDDREQYEVMDRLLENASLSPSLKVRTTFQGTRRNPGLKGCIEEIDEENFTPEELIAGVVNGMARELYDMYCTMTAYMETEVSKFAASGNGIRKNPYLQKIFEKLFEKKLVVPPCQEEAACGAAMCCLQESFFQEYKL